MSSGIMLRFIFGNILEVTFPNAKNLTCNNRVGCNELKKNHNLTSMYLQLIHIHEIYNYTYVKKG